MTENNLAELIVIADVAMPKLNLTAEETGNVLDITGIGQHVKNSNVVSEWFAT